MKKIIPLFLASAILLANSHLSYAAQAKPNLQYTQSQVSLMMNMRTLWEEHIAYTHSYIVSAVANLEDITAVTERLIKNQNEIGVLFKNYYGEETSKKFMTLLHEHIELAGEVVNALIKNDKAAIKSAYGRWTVNADAIATFLSSINPYLNKDELKKMMHTHLELTIKETTSRLAKDWSANINAYDKNQEHVIMFSDTLSDGIIKQFLMSEAKGLGHP